MSYETLLSDLKRAKEIMLSEETAELMFLSNDDVEDDREGEAEALKECIKTLREEDRALLRERYSSTGTLKVYAEKTGRSEAGLRVTLHRLRQSLRKCVKSRLSMNQDG